MAPLHLRLAAAPWMPRRDRLSTKSSTLFVSTESLPHRKIEAAQTLLKNGGEFE
jgi:hypothetical protein